MLRRISVENFRALREFRMAGLGRVNLLVGTNNCGKTSVLEAIHILTRAGDLRPLVQALVRRGEMADDDGDVVQIGRVVHGHRFGEGQGFAVRASNDDVSRQVVASFVARDVGAEVPPRHVKRAVRYAGEADEAFEFSPLDLWVDWQRGGVLVAHREVPIMAGGGVARRRPSLQPDEASTDPVHFVSTDGLSRDEVVGLFERTVLTPGEGVVLDALRTVEPSIERLASVSSRPTRLFRRGGIEMLVGGERIPIGTMGDGIWRLLGVALALVRAQGGILLVDEIDTGLHYTVLTKMWRLVLETAAKLDVQVFATTHSRDCYEALAEVAEPDRHDVSLQRIERDKPEAIAYSAGMLRQAAEHAIEVR